MCSLFVLLSFVPRIPLYILRALYGGGFKVVYITPQGKRKVRWCDTQRDAMEWMQCALNEDTVRVTDHHGYILAERKVNPCGL